MCHCTKKFLLAKIAVLVVDLNLINVVVVVVVVVVVSQLATKNSRCCCCRHCETLRPNSPRIQWGFLKLDTKWAQSLLHRMTKPSRTLPDNFSDQKAKFLAEIRRGVKEGRIPGDLIINIDRMGIKIVPCSEWTLDVKGSKQAAITGLHHKREFSALLGITPSGKLVPPQFIDAGKTDRCHSCQPAH